MTTEQERAVRVQVSNHWYSVIAEHDCGDKVIKLHCFTCSTTKKVPCGTHYMTDAELDNLVRRQGWQVKDGGIDGKCPSCCQREP